MADPQITQSKSASYFCRLFSFRPHVIVVSALGCGLGLSNGALAQNQLGFGQTSQLGGQTGGLTGGQANGLGGQTGLGLASGLSGGLSGTQSGFGANPFGSGGLSGQTSNPFGSTGMMGTGTGGVGGAGGAAGLAGGLGGLTGAALTNRSLQNSMGGFGGAMGMGGRGGMGRGGQFGQNQNQNSNKPQIRATVKLGFEVAAPTNEATTRLVNARLRRIPSTTLDGVTVAMNGRTAVIRGKVNSPADGKVVERLLSLEPGIDAVKNELTYADGQTSLNASSPTTSRTTSNAGTSAVQVAPELVPAPGLR